MNRPTSTGVLEIKKPKNLQDSSLRGNENPLQNVWTFWIYKDIHQQFELNLETLKDVTTVEEFWRQMLTMKAPKSLPHNWGTYFFKKDIRPMWEDPANKNGGRWIFAVPKYEDTEEVWRSITMLMVGEQFEEHNDVVNGAGVLVKNNHERISIWLSSVERETVFAIARIIRAAVAKNGPIVMSFSSYNPNDRVFYKFR